MPNVKNKFPFRVGTSSYIIPDDIIPNIKYLSHKVDDIEILLFESDEISNLPSSNTIKEMNNLAREHNLTYNIHLPVDIALGAIDEVARKNSVQKCLRVIELMKEVNPFAYILHLTGNANIMGEDSAETIIDWLPALQKSLMELSNTGIDMSLVCVETLKYPFHYLNNLLETFNLSVCLDIGHILRYKYSLKNYFSNYLERTKVIHLHGIKLGRDHNSIDNLDDNILQFILEELHRNKQKNRILTIEVFNESDFNNSVKVLERYIRE